MTAGDDRLVPGEGYAFHAAPPAGEWFNDPVALYVADGRHQLLVQHRDDPPAFVRTGWARLSSADLIVWRYEGPALRSDASGHAYSGAVARDGARWTAWHTRHLPGRVPHEAQFRSTSEDGLRWSEPAPVDGPAGEDCRDPFVLPDPDGRGWSMLVARPCPWDDAGDRRSTIEVWGSDDGWRWERRGAIGPWSPPGWLWEMPRLIRRAGDWLLILSLLDRRSGATTGEVRAWPGRFDGRSFTRSAAADAEGGRLDFGPDFYAGIVDTAAGAEGEAPLLIGWAANWGSARLNRLPGGGCGGPISLPRRLTQAPDGDGFEVRPIEAAVARCRRLPPGAPDRLAVRAGEVRLLFERKDRQLLLDGRPLAACAPEEDWLVAIDHDLLELFVGGRAYTRLFRDPVVLEDLP